MQNDPALDQLCINTIRTLSMDAVQKANSGHPGTPMALAPIAYHLWQSRPAALRYRSMTSSISARSTAGRQATPNTG